MLRHEVRLLLLALQFLTRVPVTGRLAAWVGWEPAWLNQSARYFPLVGALVGGVAAAALMAAAMIWSTPVAVVLSMAATLLLTGAFHEDGLADTFDGLGGSADRERALVIMKDSRIGSYGTAALLLVLGIKALVLAGLTLSWAAAALCVSHSLSRAVTVTMIRLLPYAGDAEHAKAKPLAQQVSRGGCWVAWVWPVALIGALIVAQAHGHGSGLPLAPAWLVAIGAALAMGWCCSRWFLRRLGGVTGDTLGAAQQLSELAFYLGLLAMMGR
jgi:adenosylcobinamide-GDP ribazoletransferase